MSYPIRQGLLATLDAVENGATMNISDLDEVYCHVSGTFVGTWKVQISFDDGATWADFDTGTAAKLTVVLPPCKHMRAICTAFTSGTITVNFGGRNKTGIQ